ncbi:MAG: DUF1592 domain-containing protein [Gemmataceae bacterium]|nr:DUF1592 domain-containing protein [Gemmataceae bacterium]
MRRRWCILRDSILVVLATTGVLGWQLLPSTPGGTITPTAAIETSSIPTDRKAQGLIATYCSNCHTKGRSGADLDANQSLAALRRERATWRKAVERLRSGEMPPAGFPDPGTAERAFLISWLEENVVQPSLTDADLGEFMVRRLTRSEFLHSIEDMLGVTFPETPDLPRDDRGWDRVVTIPALEEDHEHLYLTAVRDLVEQVSVRKWLSESAENASQKTWERLAQIGYLALQRPVRNEELYSWANQNHIGSVDSPPMPTEAAVRTVLTKMLTAPEFLYRIEARPEAANDSTIEHALAERLAALLWDSIPDAELLTLAEKGLLRQNIVAQVERMYRDPRSRRITGAFAATWLALDNLKTHPGGDEELSHAMRRETEMFFDNIVFGDRDVGEFLTGEYTFLNERLAKHYGIKGVVGDAMRKVSLAGTARGGLITQAAVLQAMSPNHLETSPVNRGKWILEQLLGEPRLTPPPGLLGVFSTFGLNGEPGPLRQQLARHRKETACATCHERLDSLGLGLENFTALGEWREFNGNRPVEAIGEIGGEIVRGADGLRAYLSRHRPDFLRGLAGKLLAFALGRELTERDRAQLRDLPQRLNGPTVRFVDLLREVVQTEAFQLGWSAAIDMP